MKRFIFCIMALVAGSFAFAQKISLTNTFGGDSATIASNDFLNFVKETDGVDSNGDVKYKDSYVKGDALVSDRIQLDASSDKLDGRIRLTMQAGAPSGYTTDKEGKNTLRVRGYGRFMPIEQIGFIAGNAFFTKLAVNSAYLAAADDVSRNGKMMNTGFGVTGNIAASDTVGFRYTFGADAESRMNLNGGFDFYIKDAVSFGATFIDFTSDNRAMGFFAGLSGVENLIANVGFMYNLADTDFVPQPTQYAVSFSAGYTFTDAGLALFADVVSGLDDSYITKVDGDYDSVSRDSDGIPLQVRVRADWLATENTTVELDAKIATMIHDEDNTRTIIYPNVLYKLPKNLGQVRAGIRLDFNNSLDNGLSGFSIPLSWKYTLAKSL